MPEAGPEIPQAHEILPEEEHGRYGRVIAIAVVVTTLVAALVAFAQAAALRTHDFADASAERYAALATSAAAIGKGKAQVQVDRFNLLTQQFRQADNAEIFQRYSPSTAANLTAARWNAAALRTESGTPSIAASQGVPYICSPSIQKNCPASDAYFSPEQDASFPSRYLEHAQYQAYQLTALRDGANQQAEDAEAKFVHYAAALTMLAVAVFLFGYSLTPQGQARRLLYSRVGAVFVLVAGIWALYQVLTPVTKPPDAAATAFANGQLAENIGDDQTAISDYTTAIKLRPRFVDAYYHRALVEYDAGIPHVGTGANAQTTTAGGVTISSRDALQRAVDDDERARDEGSQSPTVLVDLNNNLLYLGVLDHNSSDLRQSRQLGEEALDQLRQQQHVAVEETNVLFNLAEASLALGDPQTDAEYATAERQLISPEEENEGQNGNVSSALTDLSLIETEYPSLSARIEALKPQIVRAGESYYDTNGKYYFVTADGTSQPDGAPFPTRRVGITRLKPDPDPGHALYSFTGGSAFNPSKDALSVEWEYKDPVNGEWAVLPEISGPVTQGELINNQDGTFSSDNPSYLSGTNPQTCLPPGQYRVELYANGHLAAVADRSGSWAQLESVPFREADGAVCVPGGWKPLPPRTFPGADGYVAPGGGGGAIIFSIPKAAIGALAGNQQELSKIMSDAVHAFAADVLPGLQPITSNPQATPFFMSSRNGQYQEWNYQNGVVYSGVGLAANSQVYVGITYAHTENSALALFLSLSPL